MSFKTRIFIIDTINFCLVKPLLRLALYLKGLFGTDETADFISDRAGKRLVDKIFNKPTVNEDEDSNL